jgi:hypothetical protein
MPVITGMPAEAKTLDAFGPISPVRMASAPLPAIIWAEAIPTPLAPPAFVFSNASLSIVSVSTSRKYGLRPKRGFTSPFRSGFDADTATFMMPSLPVRCGSGDS